jgi:hypothetical protein
MKDSGGSSSSRVPQRSSRLSEQGVAAAVWGTSDANVMLASTTFGGTALIASDALQAIGEWALTMWQVEGRSLACTGVGVEGPWDEGTRSEESRGGEEWWRRLRRW